MVEYSLTADTSDVWDSASDFSVTIDLSWDGDPSVDAKEVSLLLVDEEATQFQVGNALVDTSSGLSSTTTVTVNVDALLSFEGVSDGFTIEARVYDYRVSERTVVASAQTAEIQLGGPFGGASDAGFGLPDARGVRVSVNGVRIPTTYAEVTESTDGPVDIFRFAEVRFPTEWNDTSVMDLIQGFDPYEATRYDRCTIEFQKGDTWVTKMHGFVRGVGGTQEMGVSRFTVSDFATFLTAIRVSQTYKSPTVRQVLVDVRDLLVENTIISNLGIRAPRYSINRGDNAQDIQGTSPTIVSDYTLETGEIPDTTLKVDKSFRANRHVLFNVLQWLRKQVGARFWFDYDADEGRPVFVFDMEPEPSTYKSNHVSGDGIPADVASNDALYEIKPTNAFTVFGESAASIAGHQMPFLPGDEFPKATAVYPPLVRRAGGVEIAPRPREVDAITLDAAKSTAKEELVDNLRERGLGDIWLLDSPDVMIGDTIRAVPECADQFVNTEVNPLPYEVVEVTHTKRGEADENPRTPAERTTAVVSKCNVSIHVDEDAVEVRGEMEEA